MINPDPPICDGWYETAMHSPWNLDSDAIYNSQEIPAELISSILSVPDNGACLSFSYTNEGNENTIYVKTNRYDTTEAEQTIFTMEGEVTGMFQWESVKVTLKGNQDIDIKFLASAASRKVGIKDIKMNVGKCQ